MGVHLHLAAISDANIERLSANPALVWTLVFADQFSAIANTAAGQPPARKGLYPETIHLRENLGQYWHGIHYLMCGEVWNGQFPDAFLIDGGSYVGDVDVGYGPARTFESCEVRKIAHAINSKPAADLAKQFDACQMLDYDIYPGLLWDEDNQALDACLERFAAMQHFMRHAAENGLGMAVYLARTEA